MKSDNIEMWNIWNSTSAPNYPHNQVIKYCLKRWPQRGDRESIKVLDLGCGNGVNTWFLAREGFRVSATDISDQGVNAARLRLLADGLSANLRAESAETINELPSSLDLVICVGVLEVVGLEVAHRIMESVHKSLKIGGEAFFLFAGEESYNLGNKTAYHLHGYSEKEVESLGKLFSRALIDKSVSTFDGQKTTHFEWKLLLEK